MSADIIIENVPRFRKRVGDQVMHGSNNTVIILGTDRIKNGPANLSDGLGHTKATDKGIGTGAIHLISGRSGENPDALKDSAFIYLSMKSDIDKALGLESVQNESSGISSIAMKSDAMRIVARKDVKMSIDGGKNYLFLDGKKISIHIGSNIIELDDSKASILVGSSKIVVDKTTIDLSNGLSNIRLKNGDIFINSPIVKLAGGSLVPWISLIEGIIKVLEFHLHLGVAPGSPTLPDPVTSPASITLLDSLKAAWKNLSTG